jgi:hypothetical protein
MMTGLHASTDGYARRAGGRVSLGWAAAIGLAGLLACAAPAAAQLDPLIGVKRLPPSVIVVLDTSLPMLFDGNGNYYDVKTYSRTDDPPVGTELGVTANSQYRRIYQGLQYETTQSSTSRFYASNIVAIDNGAASFSTFWSATRFETAKAGILQAVTENQGWSAGA